MVSADKIPMELAAEIEQALRISEVAFETSDAIMITDADCYIVRVNQAFLDITGYSPDEVIGKNARMMNSGRHDKTFYAGSRCGSNYFKPVHGRARYSTCARTARRIRSG